MGNAGSIFRPHITALTVMLLSTTAVAAGTIEDFVGPVGLGFVLADEEEGVVEPGIAAVTGAPNNDDFVGNGFSPAGVPNCLRSSQPGSGCAEGPGTGNRYKTFLTGNGPMDLVFTTASSGGITEYFNFAKTSNTTGARIESLQLVLGTGTGDGFVAMDPSDPSNAVLFDQLSALSGQAVDWPFLDGSGEGQSPLQRVWFPDGLFGNGGQEGDIGFFSTDRAGYIVSQSDDGTILTIYDLTNADHSALFGDMLLSRNMLPDGMFWDETVADTTDEDALIAWYDNRADGGNGAWVWGNMNANAIDAEPRLDALAAALGLADRSELSYVAGGEVPADVAALMESGELFEVLPIEDLSNLNMNFNLDVGDIQIGEFTIRVVPTFAPIVEAAGSPFQFAVAGSLDAANVPFLNADPAYLALVDEVMALPTEAERQLALESLGHSFLGAYGGVSYEFGSNALFALGSPLSGNADSEMVTSGAGRWMMSETAEAFVALTGSGSDTERTLNSAGYSTSTSGVHAGVELSFADGWSVGFMLSGQNGEADIMANRGSIDATSFGATGFARYSGAFSGGTAHLQAAIGYQSLSFDSVRNIAFGGINQTALGSTDGQAMFAGLEASWMMQSGNLAFGPMASVEYYDLRVDEFTETGAGIFNLTVGAQDSEMLVSRAGLSAEYSSITASGDALRFTGGIAYASRSGGDMMVSGGFAGSNLPAIMTPVDSVDAEWIDVGFGLHYSFAGNSGNMMDVGLEYQGSLFNDGYEEHRVGLSLRMSF